MNTPEVITSLKPNEIFVFGSNMAGLHHGGAAALAHQEFGAEFENGIGRQGQTYAIPTMDQTFQPLALAYIEAFVFQFLDYARHNPALTFFVTKIGCGITGFKARDIAPMFLDASENVILPVEFEAELKGGAL